MTKTELSNGLKTMKNHQESPKIVYNNDRSNWCPICEDKGKIIIEGRCVTCLNCGWSKCGW